MSNCIVCQQEIKDFNSTRFCSRVCRNKFADSRRVRGLQKEGTCARCGCEVAMPQVCSSKTFLCQDCRKARQSEKLAANKEKKKSAEPLNLNCPFCKKLCKNANSLRNHTRLCAANPDKQQSNFVTRRGQPGWSHGLTAETSTVLKAKAERVRQKYESGELTPAFRGKHHTEESKRKTSISRKKYLIEHPEQVPYLLNHYSKGPSYPEIYWIDLIRNEKLDLSYHKQIGLYELDFFNESKKIDLEIDGEQHYSDSRITESDLHRTEYLESLGWLVIRVRWSEWQKKTTEEKHYFVEELRDIINK